VNENYKNVQKFLGSLNLNLGNKNDIVQAQITVTTKILTIGRVSTVPVTVDMRPI
jgi:hypothetical protein